MFINNKKGWSLDLLATLDKPATQYERKINLQKDATCIHLVHTELKEENRRIGEAEIIIVSIERDVGVRFPGKIFGPYSIGAWNIQIVYDLSDLVHEKGYCDNVIHLKESNIFITREEKERVWQATDRTVFINKLELKEYINLMDRLNHIRNLRIIDRARVPRINREQWYSFDRRDRALARMINRINAIMNSLMYWGKTEGEFSQEIAVNPERPCQI